jgi:hypothetical protein
MPSWSALTPLGQKMIGEIPSWLRDDPDVRAVLHCKAKEVERQREMARAIRDDLIPLRASGRGLAWWERYYELPVEPEGLSEEQRRTIVLGRIKRDPPVSSGLSWQNQVTALIGEGWTYEEHTTEARITIKLPYPVGSEIYELARVNIPRLQSWPAHMEMELVSVTGFLLDLSHLDVDPFEEP